MLAKRASKRKRAGLFSRLIFATGEYEPCRRAAGLVRALVRRYKSRLVVLHAVPSYPMEAEYARQLETDAIKRLRKWTKRMGLDRFVTRQLVISAEPSLALSKLSQSISSGSLVVGTHGSRGLERILLGSVAEELMRESNLPTLIVGPRCRKNFQRLVRFRRIVFATDLSPASLQAVPLVRAMVREFGSKLVVVHALESGARTPLSRYLQRSAITRDIEKALRPVQADMIILEPGLPQNLVQTIAQEMNAEAIVLGIRSGLEFTRAATHLLSLTARMIAVAPCPVFTVASRKRG